MFVSFPDGFTCIHLYVEGLGYASMSTWRFRFWCMFVSWILFCNVDKRRYPFSGKQSRMLISKEVKVESYFLEENNLILSKFVHHMHNDDDHWGVQQQNSTFQSKNKVLKAVPTFQLLRNDQWACFDCRGSFWRVDQTQLIPAVFTRSSHDATWCTIACPWFITCHSQ